MFILFCPPPNKNRENVELGQTVFIYRRGFILLAKLIARAVMQI